ncbi:MAG: SIMPL domain-containing protein [Verrucomicrobiota bacterium]
MKLSLLALCSLPLSLLADGGLPSSPYLYVEGRAEIERPADMVTMNFDLIARNADQAKANQEVQAKATKILTLLDSRKIAQSDVIAGDLRSETEYEEGDNMPKRRQPIGYKVTRPFTIKVRDIPAFPKMADELIEIGGTEFSGISGGLSKEKETNDEIWEKALRDARDRAENTLKPLGMRIESIFAISPVGFLDIQRDIFGSDNPSLEMHRDLAPAARQYRLAPVTISQRAHVIYLISPVK